VILGGFSFYPPTGLCAGGGGNTTRECEIRQCIRTLHKSFPRLSAARISELLFRQEGVRRSVSAINAQFRRANLPTTVTPRSPYHKKNVERDRHFLRLVVGVPPRQKDGTLSKRHSSNVARDIINDNDHKYNNLHKATARKVIAAAGYYTAIRRIGPGITATNNGQRRAFYNKCRRFTALQWTLICFSDAHTLSPNHISNPRNERVVIKIGTVAPALAKVRRNDSRVQPTLHVYGCLTRYGMLGPYFIEGTINSITYRAQVLDHLLPDLIAKHGPHESFIFMQDGAGEHISARTQNHIRNDTTVTFWPKGVWPGNSPDLNPIEGFWPLLRHAVTPPGVYKLSNVEMRRRATLWFSRVTVDQCRAATSGMVARMQELAAAKFWSIAH